MPRWRRSCTDVRSRSGTGNPGRSGGGWGCRTPRSIRRSPSRAGAWEAQIRRSSSSRCRVDQNDSIIVLSTLEATRPIAPSRPAARCRCPKTQDVYCDPRSECKIAPSLWSASPGGHLEGVNDELGAHVIGDRPAHDRRAEDVQDGAAVHLPPLVGCSVTSVHHKRSGASALNRRCTRSSGTAGTGPDRWRLRRALIPASRPGASAGRLVSGCTRRPGQGAVRHAPSVSHNSPGRRHGSRRSCRSARHQLPLWPADRRTAVRLPQHRRHPGQRDLPEAGRFVSKRCCATRHCDRSPGS